MKLLRVWFLALANPFATQGQSNRADFACYRECRLQICESEEEHIVQAGRERRHFLLARQNQWASNFSAELALIGRLSIQ